MKTTSRKLRGSTLAEVLISMGIISVVFVLGMMIWMNLNTAESPSELTRTRFEIRKLFDEIKSGRQMINGEVERDGRKYFITGNYLNDETGLAEVTVTASVPGAKEIISRTAIFCIHEAEGIYGY